MNDNLILGNKFLKKVLPLIENAKKRIDIVVFFWSFSMNDLNDPATRLVKALQDAVGRGVEVRVLVNSDAVGVRLLQCGFRVRNIYSSRLMHPKVMIIDNQMAVIGSHNYTSAGLSQNLEVSCIIELTEKDNELVEFFNHLWGF